VNSEVTGLRRNGPDYGILVKPPDQQWHLSDARERDLPGGLDILNIYSCHWTSPKSVGPPWSNVSRPTLRNQSGTLLQHSSSFPKHTSGRRDRPTPVGHTQEGRALLQYPSLPPKVSMKPATPLLMRHVKYFGRLVVEFDMGTRA
jgi:hypothetical protein